MDTQLRSLMPRWIGTAARGLALSASLLACDAGDDSTFYLPTSPGGTSSSSNNSSSLYSSLATASSYSSGYVPLKSCMGLYCDTNTNQLPIYTYPVPANAAPYLTSITFPTATTISLQGQHLTPVQSVTIQANGVTYRFTKPVKAIQNNDFSVTLTTPSSSPSPTTSPTPTDGNISTTLQGGYLLSLKDATEKDLVYFDVDGYNRIDTILNELSIGGTSPALSVRGDSLGRGAIAIGALATPGPTSTPSPVLYVANPNCSTPLLSLTNSLGTSLMSITGCPESSPTPLTITIGPTPTPTATTTFMGPVTLSGTLTVTGTTTFSGGVTFPSTYDSLVVSVSHLGVGYSPSPAPTTALVMIKGPTADATTYALQVGSSLFVRNDGFVGIGTATPGPYPSVTFAPKFQVNGTTFISSSGALILGPSIFTGATYSNQTTCTAANTGQISLDLLGNLCSCVNSQWTRVDGTTQCTTNTNTTTQSLCEAAGGTYLAQSSSATCRSNQNCTCTNTTAPCTAATTSTCNCSGAPMCQFVAPNMTLDNGSTDSAAYQYTKGTCPTGWIQVGKYAAYDNITHCDDSISGNNCCVPGTDSGDPDSTNFATGKGWSPDGPPLPNCVINNWGFKACSSASQNCPATTTQVIPTMTKIGCVQTSTTINANQSKASYIKCRNAPLGTPMLNPAATAATDEGVTPTYICRFNASTCPDSFTQYLNWTTTSEGTADAGSSTNCAGVHSYCHTGYHPWANTAPETCTAQQINICGGVGTNNDHNATGHASITQIGCQ